MSKEKLYKLKKRYPSLPPGLEEGDVLHGPKKGYYYDDRGYHVKSHEVEDHPEFWEDITKNEDYTILSFDYAGKRYHLKSNNRYFPRNSGIGYEKWFLQRAHNSRIYSVKRTSDEEVFKVGDRVSVDEGRMASTIERFYPECDMLWAVVKDKGSWPVKQLSLEDEPLFTTRDGVDIYKGDKYTHVGDGLRPSAMVANSEEYDENYADRCFSGYEPAKEYIEEHKPRYSIADLREAINERVGEVFPNHTPVDKETGEKHSKKMLRILIEKMGDSDRLD